jgi:hypothetical protein
VTGATGFNTQLEAVLEFSNDINFAQRNTAIVARKSTRVGPDSFPSVDVGSAAIPAAIRTAATVFWRVGIRNASDRPGVKPERNGWGAYVYSLSRTFKPPVGPPPPPQ